MRTAWITVVLARLAKICDSMLDRLRADSAGRGASDEMTAGSSFQQSAEVSGSVPGGRIRNAIRSAES